MPEKTEMSKLKDTDINKLKGKLIEVRDSLFTDEEVIQGRCTERSIIFTVFGLSALVCNTIVKAYKGETIMNYIVLDYSVPQMM